MEESKPRRSFWNKISTFVVNNLEAGFYKLGVQVAIHPWRTIGLCWLFVGLSSLGLLNFYQEKHPFKLWVPPDSDFATDTEWIMEKFSIGYRPQYILATAPNVLAPEVLIELTKINERIMNIKVCANGQNYTWSDICFKVPIIPNYFNERTKRSLFQSHRSSRSIDSPFDDDFFDSTQSVKRKFDPSIDLNPDLYCGLLNSLRSGCYQRSILDLWKFNISTIALLTIDDVVEKLNTTTVSPVLGHPLEYIGTLGGIHRDNNGKIVSAKSIILAWLVHVNFTTVDMKKVGNQAGTEEWASEEALAWEKEFLEIMEKASQNISGMNLFYEAGRSFGDLSGESMFQDIGKLIFSLIIMFVYIQLILSKFNWIEAKLMLGSIGLLCVAMALIVSYGLCSLIGIPFGVIHSSLPFLLMGLGIDDMFVMKACWDNLSIHEKKLPLPNQVGLMLQHAGTSIVITSFTDIVAFLVGAITILPSLQSFCFYAAVGVSFLFVFSVTFYVAVFVLDIKRMNAKRNGILFCIKHETHKPINPNKKSMSYFILKNLYSKVILTIPAKTIIIIFNLVISGFSLEALLRLEQRFDPTWFIPESSYYNSFLHQSVEFYPNMGHEAFVFTGALNYTEELPKLYLLVDNLQNEVDILHYMDTWTNSFELYVSEHFKKNIRNDILSDTEWRTYLSKFLFSPSGARHQAKFRFSGELKCGQPTPPIIVSSLEFKLKVFSGPDIYLPAMHKLKKIVSDANFTTGDKFATVWSKIFANWVTDEVIKFEVERNLELALACVMGCTLILISNIQMCFWIFVCVLLTIVNVCGCMQRWGLSVDIVSCVGLELAIGLCVDYAAHVAHTFLTIHGSRQERALHTMTSIGSAILYGGCSTLLAVSMLSTSGSYIFKSFFKIILLVIIFGLFNGVVFLPVVLSLIGPKPYRGKNDSIENNDCKEEINNSLQMEEVNLNTS